MDTGDLGKGFKEAVFHTRCKKDLLDSVPAIEPCILKVGSRVCDNSGYETTWKCATT